MPRTADADNDDREVTTTWSLSISQANQETPRGLAAPAAHLAAVPAPTGHLHALWSTEAVANYIAARRQNDDQDPVDAPANEREARAAMHLLEKFSLVTHDRSSHLVAMHALTQRAVIETDLEDEDLLFDVVYAAADALLTVWPAKVGVAEEGILATLRTNAAALAYGPGAASLRDEKAHPLLSEAGHSLLDRGYSSEAVQYFTKLADNCERFLGLEHPDTLTARHDLARAFQLAGRTNEAIVLGEQVAADRE